MKDKEMELEPKDVMCISKLLQSAIFESSILQHCVDCKYWDECKQAFTETDKVKDMHIDIVRGKLEKMTGTHLGYLKKNTQG